jgi:4-hydroxy-3-methylbut-2-enyl diphosphate reductase IspH
MSAENYSKILAEMKKALPDARFPSHEEVCTASTKMRDVMAMTVA